MMWEYDEGFQRLTESEVHTLISKNYGWTLADGVLICIGIVPSTYDWANSGGNDFPVRLLADCKVALKKGLLYEYEHNGLLKVLRDDLVPLCKEISPECSETHRIWLKYKIGKGHKSPERPLTEKAQEITAAVHQALIAEYLRNKTLYDKNPRALNKAQVYRQISKVHPDWNEHTIRHTGKNLDVKWIRDKVATKGDKNTKVLPDN